MEDADVIADPEAVTVGWLQRLLERRAPATSPVPRVASIDVAPLAADNARVVRLRVRYAERLPPDERWLERLVLKTCPPGHGFVSRAELAFHAEDYVGLERAPLVPFVGGGVVGAGAAGGDGVADDGRGAPGDADEVGAGYFIVLGDLGERYRDNRLVRPTPAHARALGAALARLHAHRWHDGGAARARADPARELRRDASRGGRVGVRAGAARRGLPSLSRARHARRRRMGYRCRRAGVDALALGGAARARVAGDARSIDGADAPSRAPADRGWAQGGRRADVNRPGPTKA